MLGAPLRVLVEARTLVADEHCRTPSRSGVVGREMTDHLDAVDVVRDVLDVHVRSLCDVPADDVSVGDVEHDLDQGRLDEQAFDRCLGAIPAQRLRGTGPCAAVVSSVTSCPQATRSACSPFFTCTTTRGSLRTLASQPRLPGLPVMKKRSSITSNQISMRLASPECRPVVVMSIVGSFVTAALHLVDHRATIRAG